MQRGPTIRSALRTSIQQSIVQQSRQSAKGFVSARSHLHTRSASPNSNSGSIFTAPTHCVCGQALIISQTLPRRSFSASQRRQADEQTVPSRVLTEKEYQARADEAMDLLTDRLEQLQEELGDTDCDVEYSSGVLTLKLPDGHGTYVINKQPPNKQIWLSSPSSGPKRYDWNEDEQTWIYTRDGSLMLDLLGNELSEKLGRDIAFR